MLQIYQNLSDEEREKLLNAVLVQVDQQMRAEYFIYFLPIEFNQYF